MAGLTPFPLKQSMSVALSHGRVDTGRHFRSGAKVCSLLSQSSDLSEIFIWNLVLHYSSLAERLESVVNCVLNRLLHPDDDHWPKDARVIKEKGRVAD